MATKKQEAQPAQELQPIPGLTPGRIVHYVLPSGRNEGEHRPAVIVRVWDNHSGVSNLQVFLDGTNDDRRNTSGLRWVTSVRHSEGGEPDTWHWIEQA